MESESNFLTKLERIEFNQLCHATWLWLKSDPDVVSLPGQTEFINYTNVL